MICRLLFSLPLVLLVSLGVQAQSEWISKQNMPQGKHHPVTFGIDGFGYSATGSEPGRNWTQDFYKYDAAQDQWETLTDFPGTQRSFAIGQAYEGKGYLGFGASASSYLRDIWEFDPDTEEWELLTICPCAGRRHPAFVIEDDKIFIGLGDNLSGNLNDWWMYDMVEDEWQQQDNLPGPVRHHPFMFVAGGEVYAGMGHGNFVIFSDWYRFDKDSLEWEQMNHFPNEARVAGTQLFHNDIGYVLSGDGDDHSFMATGEFWKYDHEEDTWDAMPPHPGVSRWAPGSFVINDSVYFMGGEQRTTGIIQSSMYSFGLPPAQVEDTIDSIPPAFIYEQAREKQIVIYPNPTSGEVFIDGDTETLYQAMVFNNMGAMVKQERLNGKRSLDLSGLPSGVYILRFTDDQNKPILSQRIMRQ